MTVLFKALKVAGLGLLGLLLLLALAVGLAQTGPAKAWIAQALSRALSGPGEQATVAGLTGFVPFDMQFAKIELADAAGPRMTVTDTALAVAPADLLAGRLTLRRVTARELRVERIAPGRSDNTDLAWLLHPPLAVRLERLQIERLELGPALLGEPVALTLAASGAVGGGRAAADIDLHRIDGNAGAASFHLGLGGSPLRLDLAGDIAEPSGRLLARLLNRERLPLTLHLAGGGPLADWHGSVAASAGDVAAIELDLRIRGDTPYRVAAGGKARIAALLPARLQPLLAGEASFSTAVDFAANAIDVEDLRLTAAAGSLAASGRFEPKTEGIAGDATLELPELAALTPVLGKDASGMAKARLSLAGTLAAPTARLALEGAGIDIGGDRVHEATATLDLRAGGDPLVAATPIDIAGSGRIAGVAVAAAALPGGLGDEIDWRVAARLDRAAERVAVSDLSIVDAGATFAAHGAFEAGSVAGTAHLDVPDVARFAATTLRGALALDADFRAASDGSATAVLNGALRKPASGGTMLDGVLGDEARLTGKVERFADGALAARDIVLRAANGELTAGARRAPDGQLAAEYRLALPKLAAIDSRLAGSAIVSGTLGGRGDALTGAAMLSGNKLAVGGTAIDRFETHLDLTRLNPARGRLDAEFRIGTLDGTATAEGTLSPGDALRLTRLRLAASGTQLEGALTYSFASGTLDGTLSGEAPDLSPWSALVGAPLAGRAQLKATLSAANKGQGIELALDGRDLSWNGAQPATMQHLRVTARLADLFGKPQGRAELQLDTAKSGAAAIDKLRLLAQTDRPGHFMLDGATRGRVAEPFDVTAGGSATIGSGSIELRLMRLAGNFGNQAVALRRPLLLTRRGEDLAVADVDLALGGGRLSGAGSIKGAALSLHLLAERLPVGTLAALGAQRDVTGLLGFELTLTGTRQRPQGEFILDAEELRFAAASRPDLPPLGMVASADWRGDQVMLKGRIAGPQNAGLGFAGTVPLVLDPKSLAPRLPPGGALSVHLEGDGEIANIADLLPLGEDRLAGRFSIDVTVTGTVAAPVAAGQLSLRNGRYESLTFGTILTGMSFDLVGNRDRLVLQRFTASDGASGTLGVLGSVNLAAPSGPALDFAGKLNNFRAVQRDEANATASGDLRLAGTITAPSFAARLRVERAELRVPERLPQNVQPIDVVAINSATGKVLSTPDRQERRHFVTVGLDIAVDMPGQVFVRGRGLDSEWRGQLAVKGTSVAPQLTGKLEVVRGTYDFLGKTATLSRGVITFTGGNRIDPTVSIEAQVRSTDVVAIVQISGTATQPKITLSSQPQLPQDEILSRVLFGTSISQIGPAQGLEIAQAAAALATGGSPGVLDRIRQGLGLDRLSFGSANRVSPLSTLGVPPTAATPGIPGSLPSSTIGTSPIPGAASTTGSTTGAAAVSAGKYVANGVYVGVTQGVTSGSSSVDVQIDVTRHITVNTTAGQATGAGLGVSWKLDY